MIYATAFLKLKDCNLIIVFLNDVIIIFQQVYIYL